MPGPRFNTCALTADDAEVMRSTYIIEITARGPGSGLRCDRRRPLTGSELGPCRVLRQSPMSTTRIEFSSFYLVLFEFICILRRERLIHVKRMQHIDQLNSNH
jgi:hypothetical protein